MGNTPRSAQYLEIPVSIICADTVASFDVYLRPRPDLAPVLYRAQNVHFSDSELTRLREQGVKRLMIRAEQENDYHRYIEENLSALMKDPVKTTDEKAELLYTAAQSVMKEIMDDPRSGPVIPRAKRMVENTMNILVHDPISFSSLLKVISFDYYTYTHSVNVLIFSLSLAQRMGYRNPDLLQSYGNGVLLHDVGKSQIDKSIVNCRGALSPEQWEEMKKHPLYGYDILREQGGLSEMALDVVRHHHEKLDGSGYPDGLRGAQIRDMTRICTICDIFDALTTRRIYKDALPSFPALKLMKDEMTGQIDPHAFSAFVSLMGSPE